LSGHGYEVDAVMAERLRAGFIGLGNIGKPMALRLAAQAAEVTVYDVLPDPVEELLAAGARSAGSVAELAAKVDLVSVMVRDDRQVRDVVGEILRAARPGTMVALHSTVSPHTPAELADHGRGRDVVVFDAPVSGGAAGAADGSLAIMVGADDATFEASRHALGLMGSKVVHAGPVGAGTQLKLARNMLTFTGFAAASEAMRLAEAAGLDLRVLGDIVRHTDAITGGAGAVMLRDTTAPIADGDFWLGVYANIASIGEKDLGFAVDLARRHGIDVPLAEIATRDLATGFGLPPKT
jgi:3-hydroxyisobutyrate dehydrogenase